MAAELTIQSVEGLSKAFDKLSRSVGGVKSALGTMKGTTALQELQAVVAGVNKLEAALTALDRGTGVALSKIVAKLDALPTAIADALGSGAAAVKTSGEKLANEAGKAAEKAADKARAVQARADGMFRAALESQNTKRLETQQAADAAFRAAQAAHLTKLESEQIAARETQMRADALFRAAQQTAAAKTAQEADRLRAAQAKADAAFRAALADQDRKRVETEKAAAEKQMQVDAQFRAAQQKHLEETEAARRAAQEKQLKADAIFRKAALDKELADAREAAIKVAAIQNSGIKARVNQATSSASGSYSVFSPGTKDHGALKQFNDELDKTTVKAASAAKGMLRLGVDSNTAHSAMRGLASGFNLLWLTWGNLAPLLTGAAISNGFVQTIKLGVAVTNTLAQLMVLGDETSATVGKLEQQMLSLAKTGPYGLKEISEAMKTLVLAGLDAISTGKVLGDVLNFAVAGDTSVQKAADVMTSVASAFNYSANEFSIIGDVIAKSAAVSKASVESMGEAFKVASVLNKQYGASLEDVGLGLALVNNLGIQGSAAGTALRNMYVDLSGRTKEVAKTMKALGINVLDENGKFFDFVTVIGKVRDGLNRLGSETEKSQAKLKLFSERGSKPIIEALDQLERKGGDVGNKLVQMQEQIANSAGFAGIAAAKLALTSANEIQGVFSTLQASAYEAFKAVEPMIFGVSRKLKDAFNSPEFKRALENMIILVAKLTEVLVKNLDVITAVAAAYVTFKAASVGVSIFSAISGNLAGLQNAALAMQVLGRSTGPAAAGMASVGAAAMTTGAAASSLAVRATAASGVLSTLTGVGARVFGLLAGPWGLALSAAATAWGIYSMYANKAADANERFTGEKGKAFVERLKEQTAALEQKTKAMLSGQDENIFAAQEESSKILEETQGRLTLAQTKYNKALADQQGIQAQIDKLPKDDTNMRARLATNLNYRKTVTETALTELNNIKKEKLAQEEAMETFVRASRVHKDASETMRRADEERIRSMTALTSEVALGDPTKGPNTNILATVEKLYKDEAQLIKEQGDRKQRMLNDQHQNQLITDALFNAKSLSLAEDVEAQRLALVAETLPKLYAAYDKAKAQAMAATDPKGSLDNLRNNMQAAVQSLRTDAESIKGEGLERVMKASNAAAGALKKLQDQFDDYWAKDQARLEETSSIKALSDQYDESSRAAAEFSKAAKGAMSAYLPEIEKVSAQLKSLNTDLDNVLAAPAASGVNGDQVTVMVQQIALLTTQLNKLKAAAAAAAGEAGNNSIISRFINNKELEESAKGFEKAGKAMAGFVTSMERLIEVQKEAAAATEASQAKMIAALETTDGDKIAKARIEYEKERTAIQDKAFRAEIRGYGNVAGAAKTFFKEGSTGYKTLSAAEKAFRAIEFAMAIKSVATKVWEWATKTTVVATGEGTMTATTAAGEAARNLLKIPGVFLAFMSQLGPWGIPAAAAAIAALGIAYGARSPSGGTQKSNDGTGSVFGDPSAKSKSITNSIEKLADNSDITLVYSQGMLSSLKNIEANIGGITNIVLRGNVDSSTADRLGVSNSSKTPLLAQAIGGGAIGVIANVLGNYVPIIAKINSFLFGTKTTVKGTGLTMADTRLAALVAGSGNLQEYADVNTTKSFLGIKYSNKNSTVTGAADPALAKQFQLIFQDFYKTIQQAAAPLGQNLGEVTNRLNSFVVSIGKIDLQGLSGEQIQEKLTAVLGAAADSIAAAALPGFEAFQKVGEGYFETIVRVASGSEQAKAALEKLGLQMVSYTELLNKQGDVALELVRQSIMKAEVLRTDTITKLPTEPSRSQALAAKYRSELEDAADSVYEFGGAVAQATQPLTVAVPVLTGVGKIIETFTGTAEELVQVYSGLLDVREGLKAIGKGGTDFGIEMIKAAGGLDQLKDGLQSYYDNFLTDQERIADMTRRLTKQFADAGVTMPTTSEGFVALIKGLDMTSIAGQETFGKLIVLSDAFKALQDALAEANTTVNAVAEQRKDLEEQLAKAQKAYNEATMTSAELLALQRSEIFASNLALFDQIQALNAATEAAKKAASERASLQSQLDDLTKTEAEKLAAQRAALEQANQTLFDQVQAAKAAKAAEEALAAVRKAQTEEIDNLRAQLDDLVLSDAEKLLKQRNALLTDEARALFDQVQAAKAAQAAEAELADRRRAIADEITSLRDQLDDLTMTDAQKAAKQRAALLSDEARAIFDQIQAVKASQAAQEEAAKAAEEAAKAAEELRKAWQDAANGILEEIKRIRGTLGTPEQSLAQAQSAFTLSVAQAQAGDIEAAKNLPKLSQDLLQVADKSAKSSLEFATIQASTLASLDRTLRLIGGGSAPNYTAPEMATSGAYGAGYTPATAPQAAAPTYQELLAEMRELKALVATLLTQHQAIGSSIATSSAKTARILENVTPEGDAIKTKEAT